ncbi:MAG: DUF4249 domain-containing protein [Arcicella sp.]|nr:DUF4249 domain-containing protein [Arcicella sp.]
MIFKNLVFFLRSILVLLMLFSLNSCIEPYDSDFGQSSKILVVEGLLTNNIQNPDTIKIRYSVFEDSYLAKRPIAGTQASIVSASGQETKLLSVGTQGGFLPPASFRINASEKYTLKFQLGDGQSYESTPQQIVPTPPILKVYDVFNPRGIVSEDGKTASAANEVFVDFQDKANEKNFYLWRYTHYENLDFCITCEPNSLYKLPSESCVKNQFNFQRNPPYDYQCRGRCFEIFISKKPNILSDAASDGRLVQGKSIAQIPYYAQTACLVVVEQMSISAEIYGINKILESQSSATGGLADTPVAAIVGNIRNLTNPENRVVGYFGLADIQTNRYWMERQNSSGQITYILGHRPDMEPTPPPPGLLPQAPCKKSETRTPIKPEGWKN